MEPPLPSKTGTTFFRTCFNGVNTLIGFGILSIPFALSEGGWLSFTLLFVTAFVCCYTGILLQRCMDSNSLVKTYPDIGELAFGYKGRLLVSIFLYLELYLVAVEFLILEGDNLNKLFPNVHFNLARLSIGGKRGFIILSALVILPTTWLRSMGFLAYVSIGGIAVSVIMVVSVLWTGVMEGVGFHERGEVINWGGVPTAISLYAFCFNGHGVFPTIYTSMKDRTKFSRVLIVCFALCTINYALMGIVGYLMFGQGAKSQITLNLPVGKLSSKIAIYTTLINPFTKYALIVTPIANAIEDWFQVSKSRLIIILIRSLLVLSTVVVALSVPFFGYVVALTGSILSTSATMLLPCICYLKICNNPWSRRLESLAMVVIMMLGLSIAVMGTYFSLKQIIHSL